MNKKNNSEIIDQQNSPINSKQKKLYKDLMVVEDNLKLFNQLIDNGEKELCEDIY